MHAPLLPQAAEIDHQRIDWSVRYTDKTHVDALVELMKRCFIADPTTRITMQELNVQLTTLYDAEHEAVEAAEALKARGRGDGDGTPREGDVTPREGEATLPEAPGPLRRLSYGV